MEKNQERYSVSENPMIHRIKHEDKLDKVPAECLNGISQSLWSSLSFETKKNIYSKCLQISMCHGSQPEGISNSIWNIISEEDKADILLNTTMKSAKYRSNFYNFVFDLDAASSTYDTAFSAISIVSALLLTIPFSLSSTFDSDFLETLTTTIENCPENTKWGRLFSTHRDTENAINSPNQLNTNIFFSSLIGLLVTTMYFILKPSNLEFMTKWSKVKLKLLALLGAGALFVNMIFIMILGIYVSSYVMVPMSNCGDNPTTWASGIVAFLLILILSLFLLR